jgi:parallel beta-helix repeat protein
MKRTGTVVSGVLGIVSGVFAIASPCGCGSSSSSTAGGEDSGANDSSLAQDESSTGDSGTSTADSASSTADTGPSADSGSSAADASSGDGAAPPDAGEADAAAQDAAQDSGPGGDAAIRDASGDAADGGCASIVFVSAGTGLDTNAGTQAAPFKTITHAIAVAGADPCIATIQVAAGTYDTGSGEFFPLTPSKVAVIGDETNKGNSPSAAVLVQGCGFVGPTTAQRCATFAPGDGATIAGLEIVAPSGMIPDAGQYYGTGVYWANAGCTVRNNTVTQCGDMGVDFENGASGVLSGNIITGNTGNPLSGLGVAFNGGAGKVENNVITKNRLGAFAYAGADFGGGAQSSAGGNVLSCNTQTDLFVNVLNLGAQNNAWDHVPPSASSGNIGGGVDVTEVHPVTTTGATLAPNPCP